jgi:uncharacterized membrane protein YphA (DoxX/SURF4 family)
MSRNSTLIIRFSLVGLFMWFGVMQVIDQSEWTAFLPVWTERLPISAEMFVMLNGLFEVVFAALLALGFMTRWVALFLGLHLLGIALSVGGALGVRDAALAFTSIAFFFSEPDVLTLDARRARGKSAAPTSPTTAA